MGYFLFVLGKSLELIAELKGKRLFVREERKPENWNENEEKEGTDEAESSEYIVVQDMDNIRQWDIVMELNKMTMNKLVQELLNLPPSLTSRFEIEAARLQLGAVLYNFKSVDCVHGCDGQSDESFSDLFAEDEYNDDDDDEEESNWFVGFMSSDEDGDDCMNSSSEWESDQDDSSGVHDYLRAELGNADCLQVDEELKFISGGEMDVDSITDEDVKKDAEPDKHNTLPSASDGGGLETDLAVAEDSSSGSGEYVPENIQRDKYETFGSDPCCDDTVSSEDASRSADAMDTEH
jgi:hypothetical protein